VTAPSDLDVATACLAGARSSEGPTAAYYAATARMAIQSVLERVRVLELNLRAVEAHLAERAKAEPPPARLGRGTG
jgi:hypothetical protein